MSGSISESEACGNDWDETWKPPTTPGACATPKKLTFLWNQPWKKVETVLVNPDGHKEIVSDEAGCFQPIKLQFLLTNCIERLKTLIYKIPTLDVKSLLTGTGLLEITLKSDVHPGITTEVAAVLSNEIEDVFLKMIPRLPFTCKIAEDLFITYIQDGKMTMVRDDSKVYIVGPSISKDLISSTIDQFNSLITTETVSFDKKWKRVVLSKVKAVTSLSDKFKDVSITANDDARKVLFQGRKADVKEAVRELDSIISNLFVEQISIDPLVLQLLLCEEAASLFSSILDKHQFDVSWTIEDNNLFVVGKERVSSGDIKQLVAENFIFVGFTSLSSHQDPFTKSKIFTDTIKSNENALLVVETKTTGCCVASTKTIIRMLLQQEQSYYEKTSKSISVHSSTEKHFGGDKTTMSTVKREMCLRQFLTKTGLKIKVVYADITKLEIDAVICPQDEFCLGKGKIAKAIEKMSNEKYTRAVLGMKPVNKCEVKRIQASPSALPFKYVLHTVAPRWDNDAVKNNAKFMKELGLTVRNILRHCSDNKNIETAAVPVLGDGADGLETPYVTYGQILSKEICKEAESNKLSLQELYIVGNKFGMVSSIAEIFDKENRFVKLTSFKRSRRNPGKTVEERHSSGSAPCKEIIHETDKSSSAKLGTTVIGGNVDVCVICMDTPDDPRRLKCGHVFCQNCIGLHFKLNNPKCPTCGSIHGLLTGNQPPGTMTVHKSWESLEGYRECGRIEIYYNIPAGKQGLEHKTPGKYYERIARTGYLPDNEKGQLVAKLLRVAFDRRLVFTIGDSRTTGKTGVVTWNDINHKTNPKPYAEFGYPDPTYLDRVLEELAVKGVTKEDIKPGTEIY